LRSRFSTEMAGNPSRTSLPVPPRHGLDARTPKFALLIAAVGIAAWWGVWRGPFLFDDHPAIVANDALQRGDIVGAAFGEPHQPLANRPLTCLSLWLDLAVFGNGPLGPRAVGLALHLGNAILLFVTLRRTLLGPVLRQRFDAAGATTTAIAVALVWVAHPLAADVVAYATQRSTLLAAMFLLVALLAALREAESQRPGRWRALAWASMACGMASKEDFVVAPLLYVLFERAFVVSSWRALVARRRWYLGLASSWLVLATCVANGPSNPTVGFNIEPAISPWSWLLTQSGILLHYLRLAAWPWPLRGVYGTPIVHEVGAAVVPGLVVLSLLAAFAFCWMRRPWWGWLGALFFLLLAPTSTVLPTQWEVAAERRMYLPMLLVVVPAGIAVLRVTARSGHARWIRGAILLVVVAALSWRTRERVFVYSDSFAFWKDAYDKRDPSSRTPGAGLILTNYAAELWQRGRFDEALAAIEESIGCPVSASTALKQAVALHQRGRIDQALAIIRRVLRENPDDADALGTLGVCLVSSLAAERTKPGDPRFAEAESTLRRSLALDSRKPEYWNSLGFVLQTTARLREAEAAYGRATELTNRHLQPYQARGELLVRLDRRAELAPMFDRLLRDRPGEVEVRLQVAEWLLAWQERALAEKVLTEALAIDPANPRAAELLRACRSR